MCTTYWQVGAWQRCTSKRLATVHELLSRRADCGMPLVVMCGLPGTGKTTTANQLKAFIESERGCPVHLVSESDAFRATKNDLLQDARQEKTLRAALKSDTVRLLGKESVVICDALNYIKGFRYELYCASKSYNTTHCVVLCDVSPEEAWQWNVVRFPEGDRYCRATFDALVQRFEAPNGQNRWDSPLFLSLSSMPLDCSAVVAALFHRKPPPPNMSTQSQPLSSATFVHDLDKVTSAIVSAVVDAQRLGCGEGDAITVPGTEDKVVLTRKVSLAELARTKRQFIHYGAKARAVDNVHHLAAMFVKYINSSLS